MNRRLGAVIVSVSAFVGVLLFQKAISLLFFSRIVIPSSWNVPVNETASLILRSGVLLTVAPFVYIKRTVSGISMHRKLDRGLIFMAALICVSIFTLYGSSSTFLQHSGRLNFWSFTGKNWNHLCISLASYNHECL